MIQEYDMNINLTNQKPSGYERQLNKSTVTRFIVNLQTIENKKDKFNSMMGSKKTIWLTGM